MPAYYNEIDPYAAQWLRNLIARGLIAPGDVDERSIVDVHPDDLRGYEQCHFFAGIGGWSLALRLAGVPDARPVWTGSCPCQPFSAAGKQRGSDDERHLWPAFFRLIRERRPPIVFGEQVAGAAGLAWLDHVCADLEGAGYAAAAADLCAAGVGAPHIRQRLYWVADAEHSERRSIDEHRKDGCNGQDHRRQEAHSLFGARREVCPVADSADVRPRSPEDRGGVGAQQAQGRLLESAGVCDACRRFAERFRCNSTDECDCPQCQGYCTCFVDDAQQSGLEGHRPDQGARGSAERPRPAPGSASTAGASDPWAVLEWIACSDGKARPTQPGLFPLAHGVPGRVGRLRAYGNAIVPQVAAAFVTALLEGEPT